MPETKSEVMYGTLDLIVLKALDTLGPLHGFGMAARIHQVSKELLTLNQGTLCTSLARLEQSGPSPWMLQSAENRRYITWDNSASRWLSKTAGSEHAECLPQPNPEYRRRLHPKGGSLKSRSFVRSGGLQRQTTGACVVKEGHRLESGGTSVMASWVRQ
jgi:hypothetical protein